MSEEQNELKVRRILVAVDTSGDSLAALEAAAELAAGLDSEVLGIFVEDVRLLRVARAPGAREVTFPFTKTSRLDGERMERQLRAQAAQAREALSAVCQARSIKWAFRVVRGEVTPEVMAAAMEADLLTLGRASRPLDHHSRLGSTARAAARDAPRSVMVLQRGAGMTPPTVVIYDGSEVASQALVMATHLARKLGGFLTVLLVGDTAEEARQLQSSVSQWLSARQLLARYRPVVGASLAVITQAVESEGSGVLVITCGTYKPKVLQDLLDAIDCPVLLVR